MNTLVVVAIVPAVSMTCEVLADLSSSVTG